jgi:chaperone modulatory protein CbpM
MSYQKALATITIEQISHLTLEEVCSICQVTPDYIQQVIAYNIIEPQGLPSKWQFNDQHLKRLQILLRLQQDLEINLAGGALVIELMEELAELRSKIAVFDKTCK